ncbi:Mitochondrial intermediate peptidase [Mucor velutinosus]|uniref:Mitochondrial intermediate peptidase n=1 Tax=Mucor velutinosus TaxID=708070 RepID=A0AAN7DB27_9FUNG|nr:Mitochondrial intermediate peptidase [Mucor velutinosus]
MPLFNSKKPTHNFPPPVRYNTIHNDAEEEGHSNQQQEQIKRKKTAAAAAAAAAPSMKAHMSNMSRLFQRIVVTVKRSTRGSTPRKEPQPEFADIFQTMQLPTIEWTDGNLGISPHHPTVTAASQQQMPNILQEKLKLLSQQSQLQRQAHLQSPQLQLSPLPQQQQPILLSPQENDEDSVFCINTTEYLDFPVPPSLPTTHHVMRSRQESLNTSTPPTRLNSLIIAEEEEDSDDESMPSTPFNDSICYDESSNTNNNKTEQLALINTPSPLSPLLLR